MERSAVSKLVTRQLGSRIIGVPSPRITAALVDALTGASPTLAAATVVSRAGRPVGALGVSSDELITVLAGKPNPRVDRYPFRALRLLAWWRATTSAGDQVTVVAPLSEGQPFVPQRLRSTDGRRVLESMAFIPQEAGLLLPATKVLVAPYSDLKDRTVDLTVTSAGVFIERTTKPFEGMLLSWLDISGMSVEGIDQVQSRPRLGALLVFGVAGLAARKRERFSYLVVSGAQGDFVFEVNGLLPTELKAQLPFLNTPAPSHEVVGGTPSSVDQYIDQINRLADLHASGSLTDEEFQAVKSGLLRKIGDMTL